MLQCLVVKTNRKKAAVEKPDAPMPADDRIVLPCIVGGKHLTIGKEDADDLCSGVMEPKRRMFLLNLAVLGNRTRAAMATGVSPMTAWLWRRDDDNFRAAYNQAMKIASELHEDEMWRRASEGVLEPVWQGGRMVGSVRKFSDTLLIFSLKGSMPEKYADRSKVEHSGSVDVVARLRAARQRRLKGE